MIDAARKDADGPAPLVLALDTAGSFCSVAVAVGNDIIAEQRSAMRYGHSEALMPMIDSTMRQAAQSAAALDLVAVTCGPGGFTGIRTGLAAAQGIALGTRARLIGVSGFEAVAARWARNRAASGRSASAWLVALDSRRPDFYVQLYDDAGLPLAAADAVPPDLLAAWVTAKMGQRPLGSASTASTLGVLGDAAEGAAAALSEHCCDIVPGSAPDAAGVVLAALRRWPAEAGDGPIRPFYLRNPDVTLPRRQGPDAAA